MRVILCLGAALLFPLVFAADDDITFGKISDLLDGPDQDVINDVISYIYSQAKLENPSENIRTEEGDFHVDEKTIVKVPFMIITGMYKVTFTDEATVVSIPYKDVDVFFILPNEGKESEIEGILNKEIIQKWEKSMEIRDVELHLPIFNVPSINHKGALRKRDLVDADLSGMNGEANVKISEVVPTTMNSLDEKVKDSSDSSKLQAINGKLPHRIILNGSYWFGIRTWLSISLPLNIIPQK